MAEQVLEEGPISFVWQFINSAGLTTEQDLQVAVLTRECRSQSRFRVNQTNNHFKGFYNKIYRDFPVLFQRNGENGLLSSRYSPMPSSLSEWPAQPCASMRDNNESNSDNIHEKHKRNDIRGDVANYSRSHKASDSLDHIENHCHSPPTSSDKMIHNEAQKAEKKTTANLRQEEAHCSGDKDDTTANMRVVHFIPSHYYEYKLTKNCSTTSTTSAAPPPESASFQQQTCDGVMQALDALFSFTCPELGLTHSAVWLVARDYFGVLPVLPNGNDILTLEAALPTPTAMLGTLLHVLLCHRLELPLDARTWEVCSNGTDTAYNVNIKDTINADDSNDTSVPPRVSSSMLEGALAAAAQELLLTFTHIHQKWHLNCLRFRRYYREMHTQVATFISSIDDECAFDWTHIVCQDMLVGAIAGDAVTTRFPPLKDEIGRFWKAVSMAVEQRDHQVHDVVMEKVMEDMLALTTGRGMGMGMMMGVRGRRRRCQYDSDDDDDDSDGCPTKKDLPSAFRTFEYWVDSDSALSKQRDRHHYQHHQQHQHHHSPHQRTTNMSNTQVDDSSAPAPALASASSVSLSASLGLSESFSMDPIASTTTHTTLTSSTSLNSIAPMSSASPTSSTASEPGDAVPLSPPSKILPTKTAAAAIARARARASRTEHTVTLRMNPSVTNNVGLTVWPSGWLMADVLLEHAHAFRGKRVLDLGSGLGQTLIVLVNELKRINASSEFDTSERGINSEYDDASASDHEGESKDENMIHWMTGTSIIGTDYDTATLDNMRGNFKINGIEVDESTKTDGATTDNDNNGNTDNNQPSVSVQVRQLDWANHTPDTIEACASDIILSCDTIYDPDYHEALAKTLRVLLETAEKRKGQSEPFGLFAQHARTSETYIRYVETFLRNGLLMEEYSVDDLPQHFNYSRELIKLHRITLLPPGFKAISIPTVRRQTGALCL